MSKVKIPNGYRELMDGELIHPKDKVWQPAYKRWRETFCDGERVAFQRLYIRALAPSKDKGAVK